LLHAGIVFVLSSFARRTELVDAKTPARLLRRGEQVIIRTRGSARVAGLLLAYPDSEPMTDDERRAERRARGALPPLPLELVANWAEVCARLHAAADELIQAAQAGQARATQRLAELRSDRGA
jgi:hypothetical protein